MENRGEMETSLNGDRKEMKCRGDGERRNTDMERRRNKEMEKKWRDGETEKWRNENGEMEKWRDGEMERWRKGRLDGDKNMELRWKWR